MTHARTIPAHAGAGHREQRRNIRTIGDPTAAIDTCWDLLLRCGHIGAEAGGSRLRGIRDSAVDIGIVCRRRLNTGPPTPVEN